MSIKKPSVKSNFISLLILVFALAGIGQVYAQGCADAGICSAGDVGIMARNLDAPTRIFLSESFGLGEQKTLHFRTELQLDWNIWTGIGLQIKVPYEVVSGNLATVQGPGDASAILRLTFYENEKINILLNAGARIPLGDGNKTLDGRSLPMAYQPSLGTFDFIGGFTLLFGTWDIAAAYQLVSGENQNLFTHDLWDGIPYAGDYYESAHLKRGDDAALRIQKNFPRPRANYSVAVLPVYRVQEDQITKNDQAIKVAGSSGLTLNLNGSAEFKIGKAWTFNLIAGFPVVTRDAIPDGLTRTFVLIAGFGLNFPD